jgi:hypothetical protein
VEYVARHEDDRAGTGGRGLVTNGQLIGALDDEERLFLVEMDVVGRAPSPGPWHAVMTEMAPRVASVVRGTFTSRPKGLIGSACSGLTMVARSGEVLAFMLPPV